MTNEAAERLREYLGNKDAEFDTDHIGELNRALAAERRATVERIRAAVVAIAEDRSIDGVMGLGFGAIYAILDAEARR